LAGLLWATAMAQAAIAPAAKETVFIVRKIMGILLFRSG